MKHKLLLPLLLLLGLLAVAPVQAFIAQLGPATSGASSAPLAELAPFDTDVPPHRIPQPTPTPTARPASPTPDPFVQIRAGLRNLGPAPELHNKTWLNSPPLKLADLQGQVVIVEFWTYG